MHVNRMVNAFARPNARKGRGGGVSKCGSERERERVTEREREKERERVLELKMSV